MFKLTKLEEKASYSKIPLSHKNGQGFKQNDDS